MRTVPPPGPLTSFSGILPDRFACLLEISTGYAGGFTDAPAGAFYDLTLVRGLLLATRKVSADFVCIPISFLHSFLLYLHSTPAPKAWVPIFEFQVSVSFVY